MGKEEAYSHSPDNKGIASIFEDLGGAEDFLARTAAPARTAIEAAIMAQRSTRAYERGSGQSMEASEKWAGQPNGAL